MEYEEEPAVNLTPLIDIVFVILMAFMVAMPLIRIDQIMLAPGSQEMVSLSQDVPVTIKVFADHSIVLNGEKITLSQLKERLVYLRQHYPQHVPLLLQDGETSFKLYQEIKMTVEAAGFHELQIALNG